MGALYSWMKLARCTLTFKANCCAYWKLLNFIKVGDTKVTKVNVRIIAATNQDLGEEVKSHRFREDLFIV